METEPTNLNESQSDADTLSAESRADLLDSTTHASAMSTDDELPDWLKAFKPSDPAQPAAPLQPTPAKGSDELPEWLREFAPISDEPVTAQDPTPEPSAETPINLPENIIEQPTEITPPVLAPSILLPESENRTIVETIEPDLSASEAILSGQMETPDWLAEATASATETTHDAGTTDTDTLPEWLKDFASAPSPAPEHKTIAETIAPSLIEEVPVETEVPTTQAPTAPESDSEMPDWVRDLPPPSTLPEDSPNTAELNESEREALPTWLAETPSATTATPEQQSNAEITEVFPEWSEPFQLVEQESPLDETLASGPLAGIRGVLPIAQAITQPHKSVASAPSHADSGRIFELVLATPATSARVVSTDKPKLYQLAAKHWIYVIVMLAALSAMFLPPELAGLGLAANSSTPTAGFYDQLQTLTPGSTVLIAFDYQTGQAVELNLATRVVLGDLARRQINVATLSTLPEGALLAQQALQETARQNPNWQRGINFINIGYIPGAEAGLRGLAENWLPTTRLDFEKQPLASSLLGAKLHQLRDMKLAIVIAGRDEDLRAWMEQVQPRHDTTFVAMVSAAVETSARNYHQAKQLSAFLRGLSGAAEYELFLNQPSVTVHAADAQSLIQIVIFVIILIGNVVFVFARLTRKRAMAS